MRNNQGNRQRSRGNRNRHRSGGGGGGGGGNSANKVFDSNGPDVKLRGTAQTVAEKYMQLGRDAQSSGDNVAAESYYQHAEHYYRIWAANQPQGASLQMTRKLGEEEFEEEGAEEGESDEAAEGHAEAVNGESSEGQGEQAAAEGGESQHQPRHQNNNRNNGEQRGNRNERFRPKWQNRRERFNQDGNQEQQGNANGHEPQPAVADAGDASGQWEAPSFLQRPTPAPAAVAEGEAAAEPAPRRGRPRRDREEAPVAAEEPASQTE